jgi:hypothetical protein
MVGYALSCWEELELELAPLYSHFAGRSGLVVALREYGERNGKIFAPRHQRLFVAANVFFTNIQTKAWRAVSAR